MNWWHLLVAGTVPASVAAAIGYWVGRNSIERLRNRLHAEYGVAMAESRERERHVAHAEVAAYHKIDLCPTPAGCRETAKIGLN